MTRDIKNINQVIWPCPILSSTNHTQGNKNAFSISLGACHERYLTVTTLHVCISNVAIHQIILIARGNVSCLNRTDLLLI